MKRKLIAAIGVATMAATVAACGSGDDGGGGGSSDAITVWLMDGSAPEEWVDELNAAFEEEHGVTVNVEIQQWDGIQDRVTTALSEDGTVDVLEIGNTQTVGYANTGGLAELGDLAGEPWNEAMLESAEVDDTLYAAPWYGANRVVIYDKGIWEEAGAEVPTTREEWITALETLQENTDAEPIYLPGQSYYVMGGFVADEGGSFAVEDGDGWAGALATPEAQAGMEFYAQLQEFSNAPAEIDEAEPQQSVDIVPNGEVASWIGLGWEAAGAVAAIEEQGGEADFGYFPIPGETADQLGHVFLGGSNLAVSGRAGNSEMANEWLAMATSQEWAQKFVDANGGGVVPNRTDVTATPEEGSFAEAMVASADVGYLPPLTTGWANVETDPNPIKELMTKALNGEDYQAAAGEADSEITDRINRE
ncbi:N,N'-diacetylchitobiose transport system substrate-binding protein [Streptomyces zhaozhouensis]|uniref:N,N'-diacetylchitobiose transport system substrate-binding protein n=1 Tax=Streptomyces zhaozhouensis TaxID=1300267 RepID=A0A286DQA0_9ACTN|nr:extracellular solute-binding protein [Streptomyces zhaozhouensis]SOD60845.1 N,N'-diacetylchitobiose transport system substrate-binding protein [Streptomyces zhaozhouensis]